MTPQEITEGRYLGDGAYVSFDGYAFWLAANHHTNKVIALEPMVLIALLAYVRELYEVNYDEPEKLDIFRAALGSD